ncbi:homoserine O-acetyltransferase [Microaerobacter geothermalis]|uniref:homoserine O-acetyltransferase MetX n=1 Tax=Microaerobacter geothermalis TaxID=674972 RepID=UPI001F2A43B3|nr:homoserine O-acetyltransferase [Microaerobacter geothermalis]MCF6092615.1 homoserine O-acetyltransferase [Microaerobacter geothermalis]
MAIDIIEVMQVQKVSLGEVLLECGETLPHVEVAFETSGFLNRDRSNVVLVCHALTGDAQAVGTTKNPGWWSGLIGPGKYIDTNQYYVITTNVLGGCYGTTGPSSINPKTGQPYGADFPTVTIRDMVHVQYLLLKKLGISKLYAVIGGSMGGMQVLEWGISYPQMIEHIIPLATSAYLSPMAIAYNDIGRQAILSDPEWKGGHYYPGRGPVKGLSIARMVGMITYRTADLFEERFGRTMRQDHQVTQFDSVFQVESYLRYQGEKLVDRFDANSYLYLLKAMDSHDIGRGRGGWKTALSHIKSKVLLIGITRDLLYTVQHMEEMQSSLKQARVDSTYIEIDSKFGHDGFLVEFERIGPLVESFLSKKGVHQ